jgi:hypothetical protein
MQYVIDSFILNIVNLIVYLRHPIWVARTAVRQKCIPNIAAPRLFREKRIWRLMFDDNPIFPVLVDKVAAKTWMVQRSPDLSAARILWAGEDPAEIPAEALEGGVVLKTNHGCGYNIFLATPPAERRTIETRLQLWLDTPYGEREGMRCWRYIRRQVFSEELLASADGTPLIDLNFYCCDGHVSFAVVTVGEKTEAERIAYFTPDGKRIEAVMHEPRYRRDWLPMDFELPSVFQQAVQIASRLSSGLDFVRVDLMCVADKLYAGEMTLFPGVGPYIESPFIRRWVDDWDLRKAWFLRSAQHGLARIYRDALQRRLDCRARSRPLRQGIHEPSPLGAS